MIYISDALLSLVPDSQFVVTGNVYEGIDWHDDRPLPSKSAVEAELARLEADEPRRIAQAARSAAYTTEADPLFFKAQRGEATIEEWQAKVAEIRTRYPYPAQEVTP
jgi:hypothetical protein